MTRKPLTRAVLRVVYARRDGHRTPARPRAAMPALRTVAPRRRSAHRGHLHATHAVL